MKTTEMKVDKASGIFSNREGEWRSLSGIFFLRDYTEFFFLLFSQQ